MTEHKDSDYKKVEQAAESHTESSKTSQLSLIAVFGMAQIVCLFYTAVKAMMKHANLEHGATVCEINFTMVLGTTVLTSIMLPFYGYNPLPRFFEGPLLFRSIISVIGMIGVTKSVQLVPLTIFEAITTASPFMAALLACIWLGDKLTMLQIVCMVFSLAGIVIIIFAKSPEDEDQELTKFNSYEVGIAMCCACTVVFALSTVGTRRLRNVHFSIVQWHLAAVGILMISVWLLIEGLIAERTVFSFSSPAGAWLDMVGCSLCFFFGQLMTTCMFQSVNPALVGMFLYA